MSCEWWDLSSKGYLLGEVRLESLGPASAQFKIVKLLGGRRVVVDQHVRVGDPHRIYTNFLWYCKSKGGAVSLLSVTP